MSRSRSIAQRKLKAQNFLQDDKRAIAFALEKGLNKIRQTLSRINRSMNIIRFDKRMSADKKRDEIDKLQRQRNLLFQRAAEQLSEEKMERFRRDILRRK